MVGFEIKRGLNSSPKSGGRWNSSPRTQGTVEQQSQKVPSCLNWRSGLVVALFECSVAFEVISGMVLEDEIDWDDTT